jgi:hypothetical protein
MGTTKYTRRALVGWLGTLAGAAALLPLSRRSAQASTALNRSRLVPDDLARPRTAQLPTGGTYDHASQQMKGYDIKIADTGTATDEDQGNSTTFWDGEKQ